ncbi:hypothetical protein ADK58_21085 [Streptomyces sp. XY152]|nr:hypothetical protein ADK58_21085 [Streptomyces sp. XY152]
MPSPEAAAEPDGAEGDGRPVGAPAGCAHFGRGLKDGRGLADRADGTPCRVPHAVRASARRAVVVTDRPMSTSTASRAGGRAS